MKSKRNKNKHNKDNLKELERMNIHNQKIMVELKGRAMNRIMVSSSKNKTMKEKQHNKKNKKIDARSFRKRTTVIKTGKKR